MLRCFRLAVATAAVALLASSASAFTLDFVAQELILGESGQTQFDFVNVDGSAISVSVLARSLSDGAGTSLAGLPNPYLDGPFSGKPAGLGVCKTASCAGTSDDNLSLGEVAVIMFDTDVTITGLTLRNGIHEQVFNGLVGIHVGAGNPTTAEAFDHSFAAAGLIAPGLSGSRFSFVADESFVLGGSDDLSRIYISSISFDTPVPPAPEPSALSLVGLGLGTLGLVAAGKRRRA